jgi:hypothetical protein
MSDGTSPLPFGGAARPPGGPPVREVKEWVRRAAGATDDATIVVSELTCSEPGCPPYEVVMAILTPGEPPLQKRLHLRLVELTEIDVVRLWSSSQSE